MPTRSAAQRRTRGQIERLPSGSLRVKVYAGIDPVTRRRHYLSEVIEAGPRAESLAEKTRTRLLNQVDERRNPRTSATVTQLLERHLRLLKVGPKTLHGYRTYIRRHVAPFIGKVKVGELDADILDSLYAEFRRCQDHCAGRACVDHRTRAVHQCDERCRPHVCRPLGDSTIRQIHYVLSGAYRRAVRWRWVAVSPIAQAEPPPPPKPDPRPPTTEEAARIITEAWREPDWGALIWLAMTTGGRRGELCALRWDCVDLERGVLVLRRSAAKDDTGKWYLKDTKTHQQRRVALDTETVRVLAELRARAELRCQALSARLRPDAFVFSSAPDHSTFLLPDSVTQRYSKLVHRLGIETHLHGLRHYSATELISAGVDVRTVAGRLGHAGGGTTTLRVYSAWRSEADQRAAGNLISRLPTLPVDAEPPPMEFEPTAPYERIAVALHDLITDGTYPAGLPLPSLKQIAAEHGVTVSTARRATLLLAEWRLVDVRAGRPTLVRALSGGAAERPTLTVARSRS